MNVFFTNLGCKLNQAEVESFARQFRLRGHAIVPRLEEADLHVVNSCTVTHVAARDSRKVARRAGRLPQPVKTVLTGCYASDTPDEAAALAGVDLVVANAQKDALVEIVASRFPELEAINSTVPVSYVPLQFAHSRAGLKIEDGCNMSCSFCIIPHTRGRQRSKPADVVVSELEELVLGGYREVVVTGVQISSYRDGQFGLADLVGRMLDETADAEGEARLRLTSIAPWQFDQRLLALWPDPRLCRHFHLSLQSGCSATLSRMRRPYTSAQYGELVNRIRDRIDGVAITTDVIVGFPGETEQEHRESLRFVEQIGFSRTHVFSYSQRAGTRAAELPAQIDPQTKKRRVAEMIQLAALGERSFREQHLGSTGKVLWEEQRRQHWSGMTDNYLRVELPVLDGQGVVQRGQISRVDLVALRAKTLEARLAA